MKIAQPKPFTFEGGEKAVLLLHGFTGNSADVRMLGRFLEKKGYTCHAPHYKGHGVAPEELVHTGPKDWWKDVMDGYEFLKSKGHESIAAVGLLAYAREYKKREGKSSEQIEQEMEEFKQTPMNTLKSLQELIAEVRNSVDMIYNSVESPTKDIKWYEESGHTITFDKERDQLHEDVYAFLESLDW